MKFWGNKLEDNLNRVIKALEYMQDEKYDSLRSITLSYLYDIRDDNVPKNMVTDRKASKVL